MYHSFFIHSPVNPKVSRREIIKIKAEINEKETKETIAKINKTKSWFFQKINKIDKPLTRFIKEKTVRNTNAWRLNNTFLNNQQGTEEIKRGIKKFQWNK